MKTSTGKDVTLHKVTIGDRIRCNDIAVIEYKPDGSMVIRDNFRALVEWAKAGARLTDDQLDSYTDDEIKEIGKAAKDSAGLDPLAEPS